jgi:hypothetical protein
MERNYNLIDYQSSFTDNSFGNSFDFSENDRLLVAGPFWLPPLGVDAAQ